MSLSRISRLAFNKQNLKGRKSKRPLAEAWGKNGFGCKRSMTQTDMEVGLRELHPVHAVGVNESTGIPLLTNVKPAEEGCDMVICHVL